jgi:acyl carrier protein
MEQFIEKFKEQFIDGDSIELTAETEFRSLGSWDSLTGMSVLVMIKDEYGVDMPEEALRACNTPAEIYDYIQKLK